MSENDYLGSEELGYKQYYLLFLLFIYTITFFFYIGATESDKQLLTFYLWFSVILGLIPFLIDYLVKLKEIPLDTVSIEFNSPLTIFNNILVHIITSGVLIVLVYWKIQVTQLAFVKAPDFHFKLLNLFSINPIVNSVLSGLVGGVFETIVFFGFIFPTIYAMTKYFSDNELISLVISTFLCSSIFTLFHFWRYIYQYSAIVSVFMFGVINCVLVYLYRSTIPAMVLHFANNFFVTLFLIEGIGFMVV